MTDREWSIIKRCAACEPMEEVPLGFLIDSPWLPGYCGVDTLDFYTDQDVWLNCYRKVRRDFPDILFLPGNWVEFGMAAEPSAYGCKPVFFHHQPVSSAHLIEDPDDIDRIAGLPVPDPNHDGLMPLALAMYRRVKSRLHDEGQKIRMVASRGPLNIASFLMGVPGFCMALKLDPDAVHRVLRNTTQLVKRWLAEQMAALGDVEGILVLDDICGYISEADYAEFAHPYLKEIFSAFDVPVKMFHNDNFGNRYITFPYMEELGVNLFNFSHQADLKRARAELGGRVCIFGNVSPLDCLAKGTPEQCGQETWRTLRSYGSARGLILSGGGGASMGMPRENILAMQQALHQWNLEMHGGN